MMEHLGVPQSLITKINNLMNKGKFKIGIAGKSSEETEIQNRTGQGCPASANKFDINHEGNLIIYKNMAFPPDRQLPNRSLSFCRQLCNTSTT